MTQRYNHPKEHRRMPKTHRNTIAALVAITAALAVVGCTREVIVQQPAATSNNNSVASVASTTSSNAHAPINDKARLCNLFSSRGTEMTSAIDELNKDASYPDWKWSDPGISAAGDKVIDSVNKNAPILESAIGPEIPKELADVLRKNIQAFKAYANVVSDRVNTSDELNAYFDTLRQAESEFNVACGFKSN